MKYRFFTFVLARVGSEGKNANFWLRGKAFIAIGFYRHRAKAQQEMRVHQRQRWSARARVLPVTLELHRGPRR